ncbi:pseudouridine synthase [Helicobacter sp. MIT 14-3879]|uniref:pseudouridine synthase n=1 Tax=Helicobacter sp. MIT 14-3879 TaxID=2040649 RepID=UPI000E1EADBD|nr:pseudouridine synthase [Helicobacter sp. MIT 14-3879]RDU65586.1 rRNA pseudouridine synthase [Helicobacter sp. MIT 14-3879]
MRINQYIAHNSKYSRREADILIKDSKVFIGKKLAELNSKVCNGDRVFIDGRELRIRDKYTIIVYNKPRGELVSKRDDRGRRVIFDTLDSKFLHFMPVGRLDFASEGLILLSDNVGVVNALSNSKLTRVYNIKLDGKITDEIIDAMYNGISLDDARAGGHKNSKITSMKINPFNFFEIIKEGSKSYTKIKVGINEGKNRELRRFFAYFKLNVLDLKRVSYGFIELNALPSGKSRYLNHKEYKKIREFLKELKRDVG